MTLITCGRRRCDARCYNAKRNKCRCVCSSKNHQQGERQAVRLTLNSAWQLRRSLGAKTKITAREQLALEFA